MIVHIAVLVMLMGLGLPCQARGEEGPVYLDSDTLQVEGLTSTYRADGNARLRRDGLSLLADSIIYHAADSTLLADGGVTIAKGDDTVRCRELAINLDTQKGSMTDGDLFIKKNNFHIRSSKMLKTGEADYSLERGSFTTCDGDAPSWNFTADSIDVVLDEYATGRNALFYLGGIPVLYTPYIIFPVKRERQSGFLMPRIGNSTKKGFYLDVPYYLVLSPSQDVTFDLDVQGKRGVGTGIDYRFLRPRKSEGSILAYGIYDSGKDRFRGSFTEKQRENLSDGVTIASSVSLVTDRSFYRDFGEEAGDYNRQMLDSSASASKRWQRYFASAELRYEQNLEPLTSSNSTTLQRLPAISFSGAGARLFGTPVYFFLDSSLVNFQRDKGVSGQRLELHPRLGYFRDLGPFDLSLSAGYREHVYNATGDDAYRGASQAGMAEGGVSLAAPLARVYDTDWGNLSRVRHLLVPEIGYGYVQTRHQEQLPMFDYDDRVVGQEMASWSLSSYLMGKFQQEGSAPKYRELISLKLSQGYQVSGARRDLLTLVDKGRALTDLRIESIISPLEELKLSLDSRYNFGDGQFSTVSLWGDYDDKKGNLAGIGYQMAQHEVGYLEGRLGVALVKPVNFNYTARYSLDRQGFLESLYALEYRLQCWSVTLSYRDRPDNREFMINFALAGIGAIGPVKAF